MHEGIPKNNEQGGPSIIEQAIEASSLIHGEAEGFIKALNSWIESGHSHKDAVNATLRQFNLYGNDQTKYRSLAGKYASLRKGLKASRQPYTPDPMRINKFDMINTARQRGGDPED